MKAVDYSLIFLKIEWPNIILSIFLLSPIVLSPIINHQYQEIDLLSLYTVAISILWLLIIRFNPFDLFTVHLFLLPFYLAATVDLFLLINFDSRFAASYMFIAITNYKDSNDFLLTYWRSIAGILVIFLIFYSAGLIGLHKKKFYKSRSFFVLFIILIMIGYGILFFKIIRLSHFSKKAIIEAINKDKSTPIGYLVQAGVTVNLYLESENLIQKREKDKIKIINISNDSNIKTVVFVIGESSRPQNWALFGYDRNTTPNLSKETGIYKFNRMCTTAPYTIVAVPSMLSLKPIWD